MRARYRQFEEKRKRERERERERARSVAGKRNFADSYKRAPYGKTDPYDNPDLYQPDPYSAKKQAYQRGQKNKDPYYPGYQTDTDPPVYIPQNYPSSTYDAYGKDRPRTKRPRLIDTIPKPEPVLPEPVPFADLGESERDEYSGYDAFDSQEEKPKRRRPSSDDRPKRDYQLPPPLPPREVEPVKEFGPPRGFKPSAFSGGYEPSGFKQEAPGFFPGEPKRKRYDNKPKPYNKPSYEPEQIPSPEYYNPVDEYSGYAKPKKYRPVESAFDSEPVAPFDADSLGGINHGRDPLHAVPLSLKGAPVSNSISQRFHSILLLML